MRTKLLVAVLAAIAAAAAISAAVASDSSSSSVSAEPSGPVLFSDYFNSSDDPNWTFFNRYGHIDSGRLWVDGWYPPDAVERSGWAMTHIGDRTWKDYALDVFYGNENFGGFPDNHMAMIFFRVASEAGNVFQTAYRLDIWDPGNLAAGGSCADLYTPWPTGAVGLMKYVNGEISYLAEACVSNTTTGTNAVRVIVQGNTIQIVANGKTVLTYKDPTPIKYGGVGVGQIWETNGWFDNVVVRALGQNTQ